ncbi:AraC family transcriptional regulator [Hydrogenophaga intermedia]|uniref:AraC family transcriptional regulator n=1 Tax=Hydrogenophaga intermedia TaxID=65786 RepID=A0A1L1PL17_HYDIT|nr:helix-turn-helix domain-containing protein [Hydrogenophaga intermedia]TMU74155.1 AraC family transcriptional regulator [Hydrogenophaga intermedia]CDN87637.1 AraC family transcriptional regulator [Hydrogenophaga intermedia]
MNRRRAPHPLLRPFVREVWSCAAEPVGESQARIERLLPSGFMHLVLRLDESPVRLLRSPDDAQGDALANAVLAGARTAPYLKRLHARSASVGATLLPGAAQWLFGLDADAIAGRHVPLEALLGAEARHLRARLVEAATVDARLALFEAWLLARRPPVPGQASALARLLGQSPSVGAAVRASGLSHRRFELQFRQASGLNPKAWLRVRRFQAAVKALAAREALPPAELANTLGYSDQSHFIREFRAMAGLTPGRFRALAPDEPNHLPLVPPSRG